MPTDGDQTNAMTEVALALAMGFFSIMVLAMVSMGAHSQSGTRTDTVLKDGVSIAVNKDASPRTQKAEGKSPSPVASDSLLILHNGRILDVTLSDVDVESWSPGEGPVVLAVPPAVSMAQVIAVRERLTRLNPTVTVLDQKWSERLATLN